VCAWLKCISVRCGGYPSHRRVRRFLTSLSIRGVADNFLVRGAGLAGAHQTYLPLKNSFGPLFFQKGPFFIFVIFSLKTAHPGPKKVGGASTPRRRRPCWVWTWTILSLVVQRGGRCHCDSFGWFYSFLRCFSKGERLVMALWWNDMGALPWLIIYCEFRLRWCYIVGHSC